MTIVNVTHRPHNLAQHATGVFGGLFKRFAQHRAYTKTFNELDALSDHGLHDLGITRATLHSVAYRVAYHG